MIDVTMLILQWMKWVKNYAKGIRKKVKQKKLKLEICSWNLNYIQEVITIDILPYDDFVKLKPQLLLSNSKYNIEVYGGFLK